VAGKHLPRTSRVADRYGLSDRSVSELANALFADLSISADPHLFTRGKIRRERQLERTSGVYLAPVNITSLYFDGRKDVTLSMMKIGTSWHRKRSKEEHITIVAQPGDEYVDHLTLNDGTSETLASGLLQMMESIDSTQSVTVIGADSTNVNTGQEAGTIKLIERNLHRPLFWSICLLHCNELPFRHLFQNLDGVTSGPKSFTGPIGLALRSCMDRPVGNFQKIDQTLTLPEYNEADLSSDQRYLLASVRAVCSGFCPESLANRQPGELVHSRWLTTCNRALRVYMCEPNPSEALSQLAHYIVNVYAPIWFAIKASPSISDGARHFHLMVTATRYLPLNLKSVVNKVLRNNSYFAHPEAILLAMIADDRAEVRVLGYHKLRKAVCMGLRAREWRKPEINMAAKEYYRLINWKETDYLVPPPLAHMTVNDCDEAIKCLPEPLLLDYPNHTQCVERHVRLVTEASAAVCGHERRHGFIKSRKAGRAERH
jgi:hypothetical protein